MSIVVDDATSSHLLHLEAHRGPSGPQPHEVLEHLEAGALGQQPGRARENALGLGRVRLQRGIPLLGRAAEDAVPMRGMM